MAVEQFDRVGRKVLLKDLVPLAQIKHSFYRVVVEALIKIVHNLPARETESRFRD